MKKLKLEFTDYEAKKNLSNMFDIYLADSRITRLLPAHLGKHFIGRSRFPMQVRLDSKHLSKEITNALHTTQCNISGKGASCQMRVGKITQTDAELTENIAACVDKLAGSVPGGSANIRNFVVRTTTSKSIPLYLSLDPKDEVEFAKRRRVKEVQTPEDVTTVLGAKVKVNSHGNVKLVNKDSTTFIQKKDRKTPKPKKS